MVFYLEDLKISNHNILYHLKNYLSKVSLYQNFDKDMDLRIYVNNDLEFTAFEAVCYSLGFTATNHKVIETISSRYQPLIVTFDKFQKYLDTL